MVKRWLNVYLLTMLTRCDYVGQLSVQLSHLCQLYELMRETGHGFDLFSMEIMIAWTTYGPSIFHFYHQNGITP